MDTESTGRLSSKAYSYVRMSTDLQLKGDSLRRQQKASREYADRNGLELVEDFPLTDVGVPAFRGQNLQSGTLGQFLEAVRQGRIPKGSTLIVESFDRISRQDPMSALVPFQEIINADITLVTLNPEMIFQKPVNTMQLMFCIMEMGRAHEESLRKSERVGAAWAAKRQKIGDIKLTARAPSWLKLSPDRRSFEVIPERAAVVGRIFDDAVAGIGAYTIVRRLNEDGIPTFTGKKAWQTSTIHKIVSSQAVLGHFQPGRKIAGLRKSEGELIKGYFPAIIHQETFDAAQMSRLTRRTKPRAGRKGSGGRKGTQIRNLFAKVARCGHCGRAMIFQNKGFPPKGQSYLACTSAIHSGGCHARERWRYDHFEASFLAFVEKLNLASLVSAEQQHAERVRLALRLDANKGNEEQVKLKRDRVYEFLSDPELSTNSLREKLKECESTLAAIMAERAHIEALITQIDHASTAYYDSSDEIRRLIEKVRGNDGSDTYKLRSTIAMRLQTLVSDLRLLADEKQFEVRFHDGSVLIVFVDPNDPMKFIQKVRGNSQALESINETGQIENVPMDEPAESELRG